MTIISEKYVNNIQSFTVSFPIHSPRKQCLSFIMQYPSFHMGKDFRNRKKVIRRGLFSLLRKDKQRFSFR